MARRWLFFMGLVTVFAIILGIQAGESAQAQDDVCPEIVEFALASVNEICSAINRNSICYGNIQVDATFTSDVPDDYFSVPSDIVPVVDLDTLQTAGMDLEQEIWGVAVMNIQADLPNTLPGQGVTIVLLGDAQLQNEVAPETAFIPADPITVTTSASASNIRNSPRTTALVLGSVPAGTTFETDAQSADGEWLRVIFDERPAWVSRSLINPADGLDTLPAIQSDQYTPVQAFTFSTGIGQPVCSRAPDSIMIQGPENIEVTINANGTDITIGSTIVLKNTTEDSMQIIAVSGSAMIDGLPVPAGFTVSAQIGTDGNAIPGTLSGFRPLSDAELDQLAVLEDINPALLQYPVVRPTRAEIIRLQNAITNRETAIQECSAAELTPEQCRQVIGSDGDLQNRYARCLELGYSERVCRAVIGGNLDPSVIDRCLEAGYRTVDACRTATQEESENIFENYCQSGGAGTREQCQSLCESRGFTSLEECQAAAVNFVQSYQDDSTSGALQSVCESQGATTAQECQSLCESQGYSTLAECQAAAETQTQSGGDTSSSTSSSSGTNSSPTMQQVSNFCQSIGASTAQQCAQICNSNGYTTLSDCRDGMGG